MRHSNLPVAVAPGTMHAICVEVVVIERFGMSRRILFPFAMLALFACGVVAVIVAMSPGITGMPGPAIGGPFTMTGQDGKPISDNDLRGHPFLVFFGYTHCPDTCPTELFQLSEMLKALGPDKAVKVLFVSVDPERDTPAVMKDYVSNFDPRILGVTGSAAATAAMEKSFRVYSRKVPGKDGEYSMDHTSIIYLMDKEGHFINAFNADQPPKAAAQELAQYL
jgi:protein SCO1